MPSPINNPWQREGVSILPEKLAELMPIVGQKRLFERLCRFREEMLSKQDLAGFFLVIGGWGVGKSRVGHELCLEAFSDNVNWIIDGEQKRVLEAGLAQGILPIFLRYIQVTKGPLGGELEADNWVPRVIVEGLSRLCDLRSKGKGKELARNQERILKLAREALKPKGWDRELPELQQALQDRDASSGARKAIDVLKRLGIERLWLVVDEIEDITDVERDGLPSNEREGIDQALLTVIPRVIKAEEARQDFPEANFLLLCSLAVGDLLRQIRAIERRTGWYELTTNTFADVEAFFRYLSTRSPEISDLISQYPRGLKEAAFFAANRNFGWFNVIMHHAHNNSRGGTVETPELLHNFAESSTKGGRSSVFDLDAISEYRIQKDQDHNETVRSIFGLLPREVGPAKEVPTELAGRLLEKRDHGRQRPVFTRVIEIKPPPKHRIMAHLVSCGFRNTAGTELLLLGEARFDLSDVLDSLQAYSIGLPPERREEGHILICENEMEFTQQVSGLSPYPETAPQFAPYLHGLLTDPAYRVNQGDDTERWFVAPAFSFLLDFNRLNKVKQEEQGYLRDSAANSRLEERCKAVQRDPKERVRALLKGIANCWEGDKAPVELLSLDDLSIPAIRWKAYQAPLNLGQDSCVTVLFGSGASESDLDQALTRLTQHAAEPILLILEDEDQRVPELSAWIERTAPRVAPFIAIHNLARVTANDYLVRLGLLGEAFDETDLRTSHFHAVVGRAKEHLKRTLDAWLNDSVSAQGLLIKPMFYATRIGDDELEAFARGYAAMLAKQSYHDITQAAAAIFDNDTQRDNFKKMVERNVEPPTKLSNAPLERLIEIAAGDYQAAVPRVLLSVLQCCRHAPRSPRDLENQFLFEIRDEHGKEVAKARDIMRHVVSLLQYLGLLRLDGDKVSCVSMHELQKHVESAESWLDSQFERDAQGIRAIHEAAGEDLLNVRAKDARHRLKQAGKKLQGLNLDFVGKPWRELNKDTEDEMPLYEQRLRAAAAIVREVRSHVHWVYDPETLRLFRYIPEALQHFDTHEKSPFYPLWKRLVVLSGFYTDLEKNRIDLVGTMNTVLAEVDQRVPELSSGPDAGRKAFPTQAIELPLELRKQELNFAAANPEKTVAAGSTTLGVEAIGYKLAYGKYLEALERLRTIRAELEEPGKMVPSFKLALDHWEGLCRAAKSLEVRFGELNAFLSDAPSDIRNDVGLDALRDEVSDFRAVVLEGGIRQGTDGREVAGWRVHQLLDGLWDDIKRLEDTPQRLEQAIGEVLPNVLRSLEARYQRQHGGLLSAATRIYTVQGKDVPSWPQTLGDTYGKTVTAFDSLVKQMQREGHGYFKSAGDTTFEVFVTYCEMDVNKQPIDWNAPENQRHVHALMERKLLQLRLS